MTLFSRLALILLLATSSVASASNSPDKTALLDMLSQQAATIERIEGQFQQHKTIAVLPLPLKSSGRFSYQQSSGVDWITELPVASLLRISHDGGVETSDANGQLQKVESPDVVAGIFLGLFSGDFSDTKTLFSISAEGNPQQWQLTLTPINDALAQQLQQVQVSGGDVVQRVQVWEVNGDRSDISFEAKTILRAKP